MFQMWKYSPPPKGMSGLPCPTASASFCPGALLPESAPTHTARNSPGDPHRP